MTFRVKLNASYRIRRSSVLVILDGLSRLLSARVFAPIHEAIRISHTLITGPLLTLVFRLSRSGVERVLLRHSQTGLGRFHILLSDVDVTIVTADSTPETEIASTATLFARLRSVFLFLGEVEIYTASEFALKLQIETAWPQLFELSRLTKKFSWIPANESLPYHSLKAQRSRIRNESAFQKLKSDDEINEFLFPLSSDLNAHLISESRAKELTRFFGFGFKELTHIQQKLFSLLAPIYPDELRLFDSIDKWPTGLPVLRFYFCAYELIQANGRRRMLAARTTPSSMAEGEHLKQWAVQLDTSLVEWIAVLRAKGHLIDFDIYGVRVRVIVEKATELQIEFLNSVRTEFGYFEKVRPFIESINVVVRLSPFRKMCRRPLLRLQSKLGIVGVGRRFRSLSSADGSVLELRSTKTVTEIRYWSSNRENASLLVNAIQSTVGERLEKAGFLRLHAAAYCGPKEATVVCGMSGAGKSTLIAKILEKTPSSIFSDEVTLTKSNMVYAYPTPLALDPESCDRYSFSTRVSEPRRLKGRAKLLFPVPYARVQQVAHIERIVAIESSYFRSLKWIVQVVLGLGLPQMWPYMLRLENTLWLVRLAARRAVFAVAMVLNQKIAFQNKTRFWDSIN